MPDPTGQSLPDPQQPASGEIRDRSVRPAGLLPKNTQTYVILGITVVMVGAIAFSGGGATSSKQATSAQPKTASVIDPNLARIQEYRNRIDEQARKLAAEQAQLEQTKQALGLPATSQPTFVPSRTTPTPIAPTSIANTPPPARTEKTALELEKEKRDYQSLFASNVALSLRKEAEVSAPLSNTPAPQPTASAQAPTLYSWPYLPPATPPAVAPSPAGAAQPKPSPTEGSPPDPQLPDPTPERAARPTQREHIDPSLQKADGKSYRLFEGSIIETVLTNRLEGSFDGPVNAMVTTAVYSHDGQRVLIPQGSRILGEVKRNDSLGQQRLAVVFHRIVMPDGYSASLDQFKGLSQIGETGLRDQINHHYTEIFGVSLAIGAIAGLSNINTSYGANASSTDVYRQGVTASLSQSSLRILDRYLNVLPTFTIREGQRIKVILSNDLTLPAYDRHTLPSDL